jgi:hypothetical protein
VAAVVLANFDLVGYPPELAVDGLENGAKRECLRIDTVGNNRKRADTVHDS